MKKKILIISQLRPNFFKGKKTNILYFNEGCKPYKENFKNHLIVNYKFNAKKLIKDYKYLLNIYEIYLEIIYKKLNQIHNVNFSLKHWRILIGPWLFDFISVVFDNLEKIQFIGRNYSIKYVHVAKLNNSIFPNKDYLDYSYSVLTDKFNNQINLDLISYLKIFKVKFFFIKSQKSIKNPYTSIFINLLNNFFFKLLFYLNNIFLNLIKNIIKNYSVIHNTYFGKLTSFFFQIRLKQIPIFYKFDIKNNNIPNFELRKNKLKVMNKKFFKILDHLIFKYMPISYLENFNNYSLAVKEVNWPKKPKFIFSSNSFYFNDFFKFWIIEILKKKKTKLITGQHGGSFFISRFNWQELHQKQISDFIVTWGYKSNKFKQLFNYKVSNKRIKFNKQGKLLIVNYEINRFSMIHNVNTNFVYSKYLERQLSFLEKLNKNIFVNTIFRNHPSDYGLEVRDRITNIFPSITFDKIHDFKNSLNKKRICYISLNSTTYLETFSLNFPTIICFDEKVDLIREEVKKDFTLLKKVGIYYDDPKLAAEQINKIWNNVDKWWYSKKVQAAVDLFCSKHSRRAQNPVQELTNFFKKLH